MIIRRFYIIAIILSLVTPSFSQERDSLNLFLEKNTDAVDFNVIYEGTKLNLSADDDNILINLSVSHPALQMRFLMQPVSIYIDPTGKRKKKHEINLPSALDVKKDLEEIAPQDDEHIDRNERPDIRPLISALNKKGAVYKYLNLTYSLGYQRFHVEIDQDKDLLNYYVLIPKRYVMEERKLSSKWNLGIFSINDFSNMPPTEMDGPMPPASDEHGNEQEIQELMQSDIKQWIKFSIDDVNNINMR